MLRVALTVVAVLALFLALVWAGQRRLIYFPMAGVPAPGLAGLPDAEAIAIPTGDGLTLGGWLVPPSVASIGWTVIVFNGNAGHRGFRAPLAAALARHGIATLLFDYRGYGGNPGRPSERGLALDARAARDWLDRRPGLAATRVAYFGESLGAAVALGLAAERPPAALILRSPFTALADVGRHHYPLLPVGLLLRDRYPSLQRIRRLRVPLLVIAGVRDRIVPARQSERLFEAAPGPKRLELIPGADHNDLALLAGDRMLGAIVELLRGVAVLSAAQAADRRDASS